MINEEIANKTLRLEIESGKKTGKYVIAAIKKLMKEAKINGGLEKYIKTKGSEVKLKDMVKKGQLEELKVTDTELKKLKQILKKHGVKFSIMKDKETGKHSVFFQAKDLKVMNRAFQDTLDSIERKEEKKESIRKKIDKFKEMAKNTVSKDKIKNKKQERDL